MRQRRKVRNYQRGNQYPPKEKRRRKSRDQEKELEKEKNKMLVEFTIDEIESEEKIKSGDENGFSEDNKGLF